MKWVYRTLAAVVILAGSVVAIAYGTALRGERPSHRVIGEDLLQGTRQRRDILLGDQQRGIAHHLGDRARPRDHQGGGAGHELRRRQ